MVTVLDRVEQIDAVRRPAAARTFRPDIEGLRAVAVLLVMLYHAGVPGLSGGYVGVDVFFVISGYLITGLLIREFDRSGRISLSAFYARRARRILPAASIVIVATVAASALVLSATRTDTVAHDALWTSLFGANFHFAAAGADYLNATALPSPLQHYWSLAVEEQFYIVWPFALWGALRLGRAMAGRARTVAGVVTVAAIGLSFAWSITQTATDANAAYFSPLTRGWELGLGALVAVAAPRLAAIPGRVAAVAGWLGLALIGYATVFFDHDTAFPGAAAAVPVAGAALVVLGGLTPVGAGAEAVLGWAPLQWIGLRSYSLYLVHWPILIIVAGRFPGVGLWVDLLLLAGSVVAAAILYHFVEQPIRRKPVFARSTRNSLILGLVLILAGVTYSTWFIQGAKAETAAAQAQLRLRHQLTADDPALGLSTNDDVLAAVQDAVGTTTVPAGVTPSMASAGQDLPAGAAAGCLLTQGVTVTPAACAVGGVGARKTVVVFGDEEAFQWTPALTMLAARNHFALVALTKLSCPIFGSGVGECGTWQSAALAEIRKLKPAVVVTALPHSAAQASSASNVAGGSTQETAAATVLRELRSLAGSVYVISGVPAHPSAVPQCLQGNPEAIGRCAATAPSVLADAATTRAPAVISAAGATYVPSQSWFCSAGVCPAVIDNMITTGDQSHLTATYATFLAHVLGQQIGLEQAKAGEQRPTGVEIQAAVTAAAAVTKVPSGVTPALAIAAKDDSPAYENGCLVEAPGLTSPPCEFGDTSSPRKVVLFGDSHAAQWMPALVDSALRADFDLVVLTKGNCPAPTMTVIVAEFHREFTECDQWRQWALAQIATIKPSLVVVSSSFHGVTVPDHQTQTAEVEAAWDAGLTQVINQIRGSAASVTVVGDVANHAQAVPDCLSAHADSLTDCNTSTVVGNLLAHEATQASVAKAAGAKYLSVQPWFCTKTVCPAVINDIVTDFDDSHMTATYSAYLGHAFGQALGLEP